MILFYLSMVETEQERDKVTFIYENFYSFMSYAAGQVLKNNKSDIEDAVHDAMMTIIANLDLIDFSDINRAKNLCAIIAKNKAKDMCKSADKQVLSLDNEEFEYIEGDDPIEKLIQRNTYDLILKEMRAMSDTYRDILCMKYIHGMKEREIALILNLPPKTVNVRIFRGRQILQEALRKEKLHV